MDWHRTYDPKPGYTSVMGPAPDGLKYMDLGMLRLESGKSFAAHSEQKEIGLIVLSGVCSLATEKKQFPCVGDRRGFFDGKAAAVYLPPGTSYTITAGTDMEMAVVGARTASGGEITLVTPDAITTQALGSGLMRRTVSMVMYENVPASRLIVGESTMESGGWFGWPPNKHDEDNPPVESAVEELAIFKIDPPQGFALMRIYDHGELNEVYAIKNNDVVAIPRGYHPSAGGPGYRVGALWFLAGEKRKWAWSVDPDHAWVLK